MNASATLGDDDDDNDDETWIYIAHRHTISNALNTLVLRQKECLQHLFEGRFCIAGDMLCKLSYRVRGARPHATVITVFVTIFKSRKIKCWIDFPRGIPQDIYWDASASVRWPRLAESIINRSGVCPSVRLSVCPVGILTVSHQEAACDAASVHFGLTIKRTDVLVSAGVDAYADRGT